METDTPTRDRQSAATQDAESLADVLASIRALVSAETAARLGQASTGADVLMLTEDMRVDGSGEGGAPTSAAPILDEESLRKVVNTIVREELQGELGERISHNLRKLIRREIRQMLDERARAGT